MQKMGAGFTLFKVGSQNGIRRQQIRLYCELEGGYFMALVLYKKEEHIAYISLNRPENLNAINRTMTRELAKIWVDFRDDKNLWVAILSGEGKSFCVGADVKEMERGRWEFSQSLFFGDDRVIPSNYRIWKPVIAAVHRHVLGGGLILALECDIRIASDDAIFGIPEGRVNIPFLFAPFISDYLPRAIASELMFTGRPISSERAYQLGLINISVPYNELMSTATNMAKEICENGPLSNWATKELFYRSRNMDFQSALAFVEHIAPPVWNAEDSVEAKRAFLEKRKVKWKLR
jgi:E-phenylitaconyl-CoA hydratase